MVLSSSNSAAGFKFIPCSHSWVALHPNPKGVIQFIGSTLFGTFPTVSYRHFLKSLFEAGYTVIALPFRFTFNHWSIAVDLLDEHYTLRLALVEMAIANGYSADVYLDTANYAWIAHGLGCKYVMLLELLGSPLDSLAGAFQDLGQHSVQRQQQLQKIQQGLANVSARLHPMAVRIQKLTGRWMDCGQPSIKQQPSILLAPAVTGLNGAVPVRSLQRMFEPFLTVSPTVEHTHQLIAQSQLFQRTGLVQFARDRITAITCQQLMQEQPHIRRRLHKGGHLDPIGIQLGRFVVDFNPLDKFIQPLSSRDLETKALTLLQRLQNMPSSRPTGCTVRYARRKSIAA